MVELIRQTQAQAQTQEGFGHASWMQQTAARFPRRAVVPCDCTESRELPFLDAATGCDTEQRCCLLRRVPVDAIQTTTYGWRMQIIVNLAAFKVERPGGWDAG